MSEWQPIGPRERRCRRIPDGEMECYRQIADREYDLRRGGDDRTRDTVLRDVIEAFNPGLRAIPQIEDGSFILEAYGT